MHAHEKRNPKIHGPIFSPNHIRQQILKADDPDETRIAVIEFYKQTFLKKFYNYDEKYKSFALIAFVLLGIEVLLRNSVFRGIV